jgi:integrase
MAVYRPKSHAQQSKFYTCEFVYQGTRFRESTGATTKTVAKEYEKNRRAELERAAAGLPTQPKTKRVRTLKDVAATYLADYRLSHRPKGIEFAEGRLKHVTRELGNVILSDLTEDRIRDYMRKRRNDGASGRTVNMEVAELSRAIGKRWTDLWPRVRKFEERRDVGKALSPEEETALLAALKDNTSPHIGTFVPLLLLTGMRRNEALSMQWGQVDLLNATVTVGRAKTASGTGRVIPLATELRSILAAHRAQWVELFGEPQPGHFVFASGAPLPTDPTKHVTDVKHGWSTLRKAAGVSCRLHDLRHTFATRLAENGVPESTMLALMGHMSRAMLERYSHIRLAAKRDAVAGLRLYRASENLEAVPLKVPLPKQQTKVQ